MIVIATMAFSIGINCQDIQNVYNYGPPSSVKQKQAELVVIMLHPLHCYYFVNQTNICNN